MYQREELGPIAEGAPFYRPVRLHQEHSRSDGLGAAAGSPPAADIATPSDGAPAPQQQPAASAESSNDSIWIVVLPIVFAAGLAAGWILLKTGKEKDS